MKLFQEKLDGESNEKDALALTLTLIQDENLKNLAKFLKKVIIDTMIEYKEANGKAPVDSYTGKLTIESYFDDVFKLLTEKNNSSTEEEGAGNEEDDDEEDAETAQSGGGQISYNKIKQKKARSGDKSGKIYSLTDLKKITEEDLYTGLKTCDKKDLIKSDYKDKVDRGVDDMGNEFEDDMDSEIGSIGEAMGTPKLLYILMGSLIIVGVIESGVFDAPPCLSHTLI